MVDPNEHVLRSISAAISTAATVDHYGKKVDTDESTTQLDSHANWWVLSDDCTVFNEYKKKVSVAGFSSEVGTIPKVPIVDAAMAYHCPYSDDVYILIVSKALWVPSMKHNLAPPFIMREADIEVNDKAKLHCERPTIEEHSIFDPSTGLRIPLQLDGIFSCFPTRALTKEELRNIQWYIDQNRIVHLSPKTPNWDPNDSYYAEREASYLDCDGNIVENLLEPRPKQNVIELAEISSLYSNIPLFTVDAKEEHVDNVCDNVPAIGSVDTTREDACHVTDDPIAAVVASVDPLLNEEEFQQRISAVHLDTSVGLAAGCMGPSVFDDDDYIFAKIGHSLEVAAATISAVAAGKSEGVSAEALSKCWRISHADAERTLRTTTQLIQHDVNSTLSRNFGTSDRALRYRRIESTFFMDTLIIGKDAHSARGYKYVQVFASDKGFVYIYLMTALTEIPTAVKNFTKEVGIPNVLVADAHPNQKDKKVKAYCLEIGTKLRILEESTQWANFSERVIGLLKEVTRKDIRETDAPIIFWCYAMERRVAIMNLTSKSDYKLRGSNPYLATFGQTGDISNICHFAFFDWCYYRDNTEGYPNMRENLGRCLGPTKNEGNEMAQWILTKKGEVIVRRTLRKLTAHELSSTNGVEEHKRRKFMEVVRSRYGDSSSLPVSRLPRSSRKRKSQLETIPEENETCDSCHAPTLEELLADDPEHDPGHNDPSRIREPSGTEYDYYEDASHGPLHMPEADFTDAKGNPIMQQALTDKLINIEVLLPNGDEAQALGKVIRRSVDEEGRLKGRYNDSPFYNTLSYDVQFSDGTVKEYQANIIAQNVLTQADGNGHYVVGFRIVGHKMEADAIRKEDRYIHRRNGQKEMRKTTKGWQLLVEWKDGTRQWIPLKDIKESNPVDVAEYAIARGIDDEAAFAWWVSYVIKKKAAIISAIKARGTKRKTSHKYGIEVPTSVAHAMRLDAESGTTYWKDALGKEMWNVGGAIEILDEGQQAPPGWSKSSGHLIFDVKMDFTRKARWVKDGHLTPDPDTSSYAGVVNRESVRIALTYAALHDLDVFAGDIRNAYLQAPSSEKHYIICGPEFGLENQGRVGLIHRALYGGKVAGRDFWYHLRSAMDALGFQSSKGDPDVWFREARKSSGATYYEYVLLYVDDVLVISANAEAVLRQEIGSIFELKEESVGPPDIYLGGKIHSIELDDGTKCWGYGSSQYVQNSVKNVEEYYFKKFDRQLPAKSTTPTKVGYRPEIDTSRELNAEEASYFHQQIGILRWIVELGRVDIYTEVSMLSSCLALPREGHLEQVFHVFSYLKKHHNAVMVFDPREPDIDFDHHFPDQDWSYSTMSKEDMKEELPPNMPKALGKSFIIRAYVDSDHAGDQVTRRSRTGFIVYLNGAPIYWKSAKQTSCETSTFGSEFVAMKQCCEYLRGLRYKLRMMGIPVEGPCYIFGDNQSVLANTCNPGSQLKKKSNAICYHFVREGCARGEWIATYIKSEYNIADLLTKPLPSGEKRFYFVRKILLYI